MMEKQLLLLLLITSAVHKSDHFIDRQHFKIVDLDDDNESPLSMTWSDAREQCRYYNSTMFTLDLMTESELRSFTDGLDVVWMGLRKHDNNTAWHWLNTGLVLPTTGDISQSLRWSVEGSSNEDKRVDNDCGAFNAQKKTWQSYPCDTLHKVMCYEDNLVVVRENKTWEEAIEHCKSLNQRCSDWTCEIRHKLLTVDSTSDYHYVRKRIYKATTDEVWTGLRFLAGQWWWLNGKPVNDEGKLPKCPVNGNHCGVVSKTDGTTWLTADCSKKLNFVCYKVTVSRVIKTVV